MISELLDKYSKIVIFDLETTGLSGQTDHIVEFGALIVDKNGVHECNQLVDPKIHIPEHITAINHINDEMVQENGLCKQCLFRLIKPLFTEDTLVIAYNIQFDMCFIIELFKDMNVELPKFDILDVMAMYKDYHPYPHKLGNLVQTYGVTVQNTHRAIDDVGATWEGMQKINAAYGSYAKFINVVGYNPRWGVNGIRLPHVKYIVQNGAKKEISNE